MNVYVDSLRACLPTEQWHYEVSCHLFADSEAELHVFANALGLRKGWFQPHERLPHYDLTARRREMAIRQGAIAVDRRFMYGLMRSRQEPPKGKP